MTSVNVMAPLVVGDPVDPDNDASRAAWKRFDEELASAKALGITAVSTDVWWGLVEKSEGQYDFRYYEKVSNHIIQAGLKWMPIISLHQCGGNVGDNVHIPLPGWIWAQLARKLNSNNNNIAKYISEQGNTSNEVVSVWATDAALDNYVALFRAFQTHFSGKASHIAEINISLGPAGELRYPSYNAHDSGSDYPSRGALQCYSELARKSFLDWVLNKYGTWSAVNKAWGVEVRNIEPPRDCKAFFEDRVHLELPYGRDFFDWYSDSLLAHGRKVMTAALDTFGAREAAFEGIDVGAKVPGVHWTLGYWLAGKRHIHTRLAELAAGIIRTSDAQDWQSDDSGRGYRPIVTVFAELAKVKPSSRVVLHFTCLEMKDLLGDDNVGINSLARSLVQWVGMEAKRQGAPIKGENALNFTLASKASWDSMRSALEIAGQGGAYTGLTLLRMHDVVINTMASEECRKLCEMAQKAQSVVPITGAPTAGTQNAA